MVELVFKQVSEMIQLIVLLKKSHGKFSGDREETSILSSYRLLGSF